MEESPIQEQEDVLLVSPTGGGDPFHKKAYFLKPIVPISSIDHEPPFKLPQCPFRFDPKQWPLEVEFHGWRQGQEDWNSWVDRLAPIHQSTWKRAGIYDAIFNSKYQIRRKTDLVFGFAEKWCSETNTFIFPWGEATITLEDVMVLGGFSVSGDSIFSPLESIELKEVEERLIKVRKEVKRAKASKWLQKFVNSESELEHEAFLAFWLSRYVFFDGDSLIQKRVFPIAIHLARGTRIALAQPVLADIYNDLSLLNSTIVASIELKTGDCVLNVKLKSPFQLVQVWAWERFLELRPIFNVIKYGEPRLARWDKANGLSIENLRSVLDSAGNAFMWRPYAMAIENWNFPKYYSEKEMWVGPGLDDEFLQFSICLRVTKLVGFNTRKQYFPHRVAMQFGYDQDIPCKIAQSKVSRKHCSDKTEIVGFYIPSRLSEPNVSARYLKWWNESVSGLKDTSEVTMPQKKKAKRMEGSLVRAKQSPVHPEYPLKKNLERSKKRKRKESLCFRQSAPDIMVEEKEELMVSPTGGDPFPKKAYYLKPVVPSSIEQPPFKFPTESFSPLPSDFEPRKWPLEVDIPGWRVKGQKDDWNDWVDQLALVHQSTWKTAGIYEAIFNSTYEIRRKNDLVYGFAEKWCSETNTFIFPWGEATITLEDVMVMGGYSVLGESIFSPLESRELKEIEEKLNQERTEINRGASRRPSTSLWLKKFMNSGTFLEHEAFLAFWLSRYVFPDAHSTIQKHVFPIAIHLARGTRIALAPAVLASIYKDLTLLKCAIVDSSKLRTGCDAIKLSIKSPFQFVQLWAWERFVELSPNPRMINFAQPRLARWDKVSGVEVENLRKVLDSAGDGFKWRPYALTIENWQLPKYYPVEGMHVSDCWGLDDELHSFFRCLRVSELAGFGTIEQYLPHRVAMQFGFDQDIPCIVARSNQSTDIAWNHYIKEIQNARLYVPSTLSKADISTRYLKWWKESVSGLKKSTMSKLENSKCMGGSLPRAKPAPVDPGSAPEKAVEGSKKRKKNNDFTLPSVSVPKYSDEGNDSLVLPGFPPKCSIMEAGGSVDEDGLTLSEIWKYCKKQKNVNTRTCGQHKKLAGQVQSLASSIGASSVDTMKSERLEDRGPIDEDGPSLSETFENSKKHKNGETRMCGDSEKLSGQGQDLASSIAESSVDTVNSEKLVTEDMLNKVLIGRFRAERNLKTVMRSNARSSDNEMASIVDNECASSSSQIEKRVSVLKARASRLESIVSMLKENYPWTKF
ncbi:putative protein-serine/threonine phosphatase [Rosa chinensis]|uniref:Aminotransferase-like plant mobile domain-containing protein n=1 Tax=Rosa chinensis TaxID=74649 RepID=A0A2P6QC42_ROSCH|nr:uncharacterized protein LOC112202387 [Rosa chinensis]XP_040363310.1 uncharacterized protein LOC112202387 [Rosa chinensis]XP_040363311.1 uncharacterized protein LOC112202387 [Rosa chinensis]PRQ31740.1 putative protein-serine/threonine phosphatase [Rosa chinensis]